jgi:cysteine desulfurase family protein
MIYLDNAATSYPKPDVVGRAMTAFLDNDAANPGRGGHGMAVRASQVVWQARLAIARLIGTSMPARIVFASNCTDALNTAIHGVLRPGDHVVTTSIEHNSVIRPLVALRSVGITHTRVPCDGDGRVSVADLEAAIESRTRLVVVCHGSNVSGVLQAVGEIGRMVRDRGLLFLVDAAQTLGVVPVDVETGRIDLLAFPGHKGLYGPTGTGGLYVGERVEIRPLRQGGTGSSSESEQQPDQLPDRLESGTLNTVGIAGLLAAVQFVLEQGVDRLGEHDRALAVRLIAGLEAMDGVKVLAAAERSSRVGVVSFTALGWEPTDLAVVLDQSFGIAARAGLHCAPCAHRTLGTFPKGTVRLSPGWFNTAEEIDRVLEAVRQVLGG